MKSMKWILVLVGLLVSSAGWAHGSAFNPLTLVRSQVGDTLCESNPDMFVMISGGLSHDETITAFSGYIVATHGNYSEREVFHRSNLHITGDTPGFYEIFANSACLVEHGITNLAGGLLQIKTSASYGSEPVTNCTLSGQPAPGNYTLTLINQGGHYVCRAS